MWEVIWNCFGKGSQGLLGDVLHWLCVWRRGWADGLGREGEAAEDRGAHVSSPAGEQEALLSGPEARGPGHTEASKLRSPRGKACKGQLSGGHGAQ